jgi:hypothetical protein
MMLIRQAQGKVPFDQINTIIIDPQTKRIIHSNHPNPRYHAGHMIDEAIQRNAIGRGWNVIYRRGDKLMTEQISVSDLLNQVIIANEKEGRFSVFEKGEILVFAQMRGDKVFVEDENGDEKWFDYVEEFLKSIPGYVLSGVIDDEDMEDEQGDE